MVSSVYDPLGFVAPFILVAKSILQQLCQDNVPWDSELPERVLNKWNQWLQDLKGLEAVKLQRCLKPKELAKIVSCELHTFADASDHGYGAVSYIRIVDESGRIWCSFLLGKARVAPLKRTAIPRLELTAAVLAVKLSKMITKELEYSVDSAYYWSDSMTTLRYIANEGSRFHTFVANRVSLIREATSTKQWNYIPSALNPADYASRGLPMKKFLATSQWFNGPDFLWGPERNWPTQPEGFGVLENDLEVKKVVNVAVVENPHPMENLIKHYSSWRKLKSAIGWLILTCRKLREIVRSKQNQLKQPRCNLPALTVDILCQAEMVVVKYVQEQCFENEMLSLQTDGRIKKSSVLRKLNPTVMDGLLRVGGRLSRANISFDAKYPIILPKDAQVSRLILEETHRSVGHLGVNSILAVTQQKFWILGAKSMVKRIMSNCVICRHYQGVAMQQKMADLPADRLVPGEPPFTRVGMDFFGPYEVRRGRSLVKRYGVVFTCLAIRAVHIEIAHSLDTDSCINAIRRFVARRGTPKTIRSDNGTNLVGSEREMREEIERWNYNKIGSTLLQKGITWDFNPPAASHFGGVWERLIRVIRKVLYSVLHEQTIRLDDEGLHTLMCEVEAIINGRPITGTRDTPGDLSPLTPNHLLILRSGEQLPPGMFEKGDSFVRRRWRHVQYLADMFWKRWVREYLPLLLTRQRWFHPKRNVSVGDVVLIMDNSPRNSWSMGKVIEVMADKSGLVRSAKLKTSSSILYRPIAKLCLLLEADK